MIRAVSGCQIGELMWDTYKSRRLPGVRSGGT